VEVIGEEECKSLVITQSKVFYSPVSSTTLKKRAQVLLANEIEVFSNQRSR
jgi:hypothetical protein